MFSTVSGCLYPALPWDNTCCCFKGRDVCVIAAIEITTLAIGILTLLQVGAFQGLSSTYGIVLTSVGGVMLVIDIVFSILNKNDYEERKKEENNGLLSSLERYLRMEIKKVGADGYLLDLSKLCKLNEGDNRNHCYPIYTKSQAQGANLNNGECIFYFSDNDLFTKNFVYVRSKDSQGTELEIEFSFTSLYYDIMQGRVSVARLPGVPAVEPEEA